MLGQPTDVFPLPVLGTHLHLKTVHESSQHCAAIWIVATRWTVGSGLESRRTESLSVVVGNWGHLVFFQICALQKQNKRKQKPDTVCVNS